MALYRIEDDFCLGWSHSGPVNIKCKGFVELTEDEVARTVELIRKEGTSDIKKLKLEELYPDTYEKLDDAYSEMTFKADKLHWLWEGYRNRYYEYDRDELKSYCIENCGFDDEIYDFESWLNGYLAGLDDEDAIDFFKEHMNAEVEGEDLEYEVAIPKAIIKMAEKKE